MKHRATYYTRFVGVAFVSSAFYLFGCREDSPPSNSKAKNQQPSPKERGQKPDAPNHEGSIFSVRRNGGKPSSEKKPEYEKAGWDFYGYDLEKKKMGSLLGYTVTCQLSDFLDKEALARPDFKYAEKANSIYTLGDKAVDVYVRKGVAVTGMVNTAGIPGGDEATVIAVINTKADRIKVLRDDSLSLGDLVRHWDAILKD